VVEVREVAEDGLAAWVELRGLCNPEPTSVEAYLDWKRQAEDAQWFTASLEGDDAGVAVAVLGWHSPPGVARFELDVRPERRGHGVGSALLTTAGAWSRAGGCSELLGAVREADPASLRWAENRGFREVGRNSMLVLDLARAELPEVAAPQGIEITTWAERPDLVRGIYAVAREAYPDVPGEGEAEMASFESGCPRTWRARATGRKRRSLPSPTARSSVTRSSRSRALDRPWPCTPHPGHVVQGHGRGIAGALKRAEIAWAKTNGYTRLETFNEERNEPIRRLNERHGYRPEPGQIIVRGPIA